MAILRNIAVHHTGGRAGNERWSSQHMNAQGVNLAHRNRPDWIGYHAHKSSLGYYGGYNFFIDKTGQVTQFRALGEETLAQRGHNFDTVSICLAGNFTSGVDTPSGAQISALRTLIRTLLRGAVNYKIAPNTSLELSKWRVWPHRHFQGTACYGSGLSDTWARDLITAHHSPDTSALKKRLMAEIARLMALIIRVKNERGLAGEGHSCSGHVI